MKKRYFPKRNSRHINESLSVPGPIKNTQDFFGKLSVLARCVPDERMSVSDIYSLMSAIRPVAGSCGLKIF